MSSPETAWHVLPHGPLEKLSPSLWRVQGDLPNNPLKRVMTVIKKKNGDLIVHSAVALDEKSMQEIDAWGKVAYILVPNSFHRLDAPRYKARYPTAKIVCPKNAAKGVAQKVPVDAVADVISDPPHIEWQHIDGTSALEGVMIVRETEGTTLIFNDVLFNMPHLGGVSGFIFKHITQSSGPLHFTRISKLFLVKQKEMVRQHIMRLADEPNLKRIIVSHHETLEHDAAQQLRNAAAAL